MRDIPQYIQQLSMGVSGPVQLSSAQARATSQASDMLNKFAQDIYSRDVEIQKTKALSQMRIELARQYDESQNDPIKLKQAQNGYKEGFLKGIKSPDLAEQFTILYDTEAAAHLAKATEIKKKMQDQEHEASILSLIQSSIESGSRYYDNVDSKIPEYVLGAEKALGANAVSFDELINAKNSDGTYMFTPNQKVSFSTMLNDGIKKRAEQIQAARIADEQLKATDYAEWADRQGMTPMQIIQSQTGQPRIDVIGATKAKVYAEAAKQSQTPEGLAQVAMQLKQEYGEYSGQAVKRIAAGLDNDKAAALNLMVNDGGNYSEQIKMLNDISPLKDSQIDEEYKSTVIDGGLQKPADIETAVFTNPEIVRNAAAMTQEGDALGAQSYRKQLERLAKAYQVRNPSKSMDEAIEFANRYTLDNYTFGKLNGVDYRIPAKLPDGRPIDKGTASLIEDEISDKINTLDLAVGGTPIRQRDSVVAILNDDKDGVLFKDSQTNTLILDSTGMPAKVKFGDVIESINKNAQAEMEPKRKNKLYLKRISGKTYEERKAIRKEMFGIKE